MVLTHFEYICNYLLWILQCEANTKRDEEKQHERLHWPRTEKFINMDWEHFNSQAALHCGHFTFCHPCNVVVVVASIVVIIIIMKTMHDGNMKMLWKHFSKQTTGEYPIKWKWMNKILSCGFVCNMENKIQNLLCEIRFATDSFVKKRCKILP